MAAAAVRYLRSAGASTVAGHVEALPRPELRAVGDDERAPVDQVAFRRVLGNFATGVTVITAPGVEGEAGGERRPGSPVSRSRRFHSIRPWSASWWGVRRRPGRGSPARACYCVNVLGAHQGELCRGFAVSGADKFAGVVYDAAPVSGSPRLAGAAAWVDCTIHAVHTGGTI